MHMLLLILFRLGKYDFVKTGEPVEEKVEQGENPVSQTKNESDGQSTV